MKVWSCFMIMAMLLFTCIIANAQQGTATAKPVHQLRIYEVFKDNKSAFHERFRDHAARIMKKYGYNIISIWESQKENKIEFVYLLQWESESAMKEAWVKFMADQEWIDIKKKTSAQHGRMVGEIEDRILITTDYSPVKSFITQ
jgi:heme-degrading monooxygenase HmoA